MPPPACLVFKFTTKTNAWDAKGSSSYYLWPCLSDKNQYHRVKDGMRDGGVVGRCVKSES